MTNQKATSSTFKNKISFLEDLVEIYIHKKTKNITKKTYIDAAKTFFDYIAEEADKETCLSFKLPNLGYLYKPLVFIHPKDVPDEDKKDRLLNQIGHIRWHFDKGDIRTPHVKTTLVVRAYHELKDMYILKDLSLKAKNDYRVLLAVEEVQNKKFNKIHGK